MRKVGLIILVLLGTLLIVRWCVRFVAQDRCLDQGGRWDSRTASCQRR